MSLELNLLRFFCADRKIEATHYGYLEEIENLEREIKLLFNLIHTYYQEFEEPEEITHADLLSFYDLKYPKARDRELHIDLITSTFNSKTNPDLMKSHLDHLIEKHHAAKMVNALLPVLEGEKYGILDTMEANITSYVDLLHNPPDRLVVPVPCTLSVKDLIQKQILEPGIPWHIPELNNIVGGLRPKTLGLIYAFVGAGKTSFSMASCANFLQSIKQDEVIAYCGNEEDSERLRFRLTQSILNWTRNQLVGDQDGADREAKLGGLDQVAIFDGIISGEQIEYILKEYKPVIMYVDQSTDVDITLKRKRDGVDYLKALFKWYRALATKHECSIIGVAQGVPKAEDTKYLKLSDIYGARVAIQGSLDYAIGIGKLEEDPVDENQRYINVPKNKLLDGDGGKFASMFNHYINEWKIIGGDMG